MKTKRSKAEDEEKRNNFKRRQLKNDNWSDDGESVRTESSQKDVSIARSVNVTVGWSLFA
jgi:hypothetical protein